MPGSQPNTNILSARTAGAVFAIVAILVCADLWLCDGHLVYTLDDPYISLGLGWHIWHGHYGVNATEFSSPSSSILYPFLLALFGWSDLQIWAPLIINTAAAVATAALFAAMSARYGISTKGSATWRSSLLLVVLCLALNLVGLVFTGLEHSLHTLVSVAVIFGLALTFERGWSPGWLIPAVVCAPLLRFEGLALAVLALMGLALAGHHRSALIGSAVTAVLIGLYMWGMTALGLPLLPSSVLVKGVAFQPGASHFDHAVQIVKGALWAALHYKGAYPAWIAAAFVVLHPVLRLRGRLVAAEDRSLTLRDEWILAGVVVGTLTAHTFLGAWGWYYRYEIYALAATLAGLLVIWHREIAAYITEATPRAIVGVAVLLLLSTAPYLRGTLLSPRAGLGIYDQQYQMRRFVVDYYRRPVAVNDLGWVSYRNPNYVLDLWGLASEAARKKRLLDPTPGWPETLTRAHDVGLAIIYETWFEGAIPAIWQPLARLEGAHHLVIGGGNFVTFYATSPAAAPAALDALHRFSATLPANVATLTVTDSASNTAAVAKSR